MQDFLSIRLNPHLVAGYHLGFTCRDYGKSNAYLDIIDCNQWVCSFCFTSALQEASEASKHFTCFYISPQPLEASQVHQLSISCFKMNPSYSRAKEAELKKLVWERNNWEHLLALEWNIHSLQSSQRQETSFHPAIRMSAWLSSAPGFPTQ